LNITVSIIEDDAAVRRLLARWINQTEGFCCVSEHDSVASALAQLPPKKPDVVLVDINLPGQNGIQCVVKLKPLMPKTQFLMLTVYEDSDHIFEALTAGASGYLLKRTRREQLLASIKQVYEGGSPMTSYIARKVVQLFQQTQWDKTELSNLSSRELEVLEVLVRGYSYKEIAGALGITTYTVNTHTRHIYEKLHVRSRNEAAARFGQLLVDK
jgi:DNA-binding NarL/FixJ family response regulator